MVFGIEYRVKDTTNASQQKEWKISKQSLPMSNHKIIDHIPKGVTQSTWKNDIMEST